MESELKRKEVWLHPTVTGRLQTLATKKGWSLKQYMEWALTKESSKAISGKPVGYMDNMAPMLGEAINGTRKTKRK
jgi:hypothetical protein